MKKDFKYRFVFCYLLKIAMIVGVFAKYAVGIPISEKVSDIYVA